MASANKRVIKKTRVVEEEYTEEDGLVLQLSKDESHFLAALLGSHIFGSGKAREVSDGIWSALIKNGYGVNDNKRSRDFHRLMDGSVGLKGDLDG